MGGSGKGKGKAAPPPPKAQTAEEREKANIAAQRKREQEEFGRREAQEAERVDEAARNALKARLGVMHAYDIYGAVPWSNASLYVHLLGSYEGVNRRWYVQGASPGVLAVDLGCDQVVCVRRTTEIVSEFMAEQLAVGLNIPIARSRIVRPDEAEFLQIEAMMKRCRPKASGLGSEEDDMCDAGSPFWARLQKDAPDHYLVAMRQLGRRTSLAVLEFVQGTSLGTTAEDAMLSAGNVFWQGVGSVCALDVVINNMDRVPLPVFDNREGNLGNVIVTSTGAVGIDQQINVIRNEEGIEKYLGRVRALVHVLLQPGSPSDDAFASGESESIIDSIIARIKIVSAPPSREQVVILVQALKEKLLEIAKGWISGSVSSIIDAAEIAACERIVATQRMIHEGSWTAAEIEIFAAEEAREYATFLRRIVGTICEAVEHASEPKSRC